MALLTPGTRVPQYQILTPLGAGGMGEVYLAQDTRLERKVAVKLLGEEFNRSEDRLRRFVGEARATRDQAFSFCPESRAPTEGSLTVILVPSDEADGTDVGG